MQHKQGSMIFAAMVSNMLQLQGTDSFSSSAFPIFKTKEMASSGYTVRDTAGPWC